MQQKQLNKCFYCGKSFKEWKLIIYSDDTVQKQCPYCLCFEYKIEDDLQE